MLSRPVLRLACQNQMLVDQQLNFFLVMLPGTGQAANQSVEQLTTNIMIEQVLLATVFHMTTCSNLTHFQIFIPKQTFFNTFSTNTVKLSLAMNDPKNIDTCLSQKSSC